MGWMALQSLSKQLGFIPRTPVEQLGNQVVPGKRNELGQSASVGEATSSSRIQLSYQPPPSSEAASLHGGEVKETGESINCGNYD